MGISEAMVATWEIAGATVFEDWRATGSPPKFAWAPLPAVVLEMIDKGLVALPDVVPSGTGNCDLHTSRHFRDRIERK